MRVHWLFYSNFFLIMYYLATSGFVLANFHFRFESSYSPPIERFLESLISQYQVLRNYYVHKMAIPYVSPGRCLFTHFVMLAPRV